MINFINYRIQDGIKDSTKRKRRLVCQFSNGLDDASQPSVATKMSAKEGKFWKARLESITNEYKKWREISRKQIKSINNDGTTQILLATASANISIPFAAANNASSGTKTTSGGSFKSNSYQSEKGAFMSHLGTCLDDSALGTTSNNIVNQLAANMNNANGSFCYQNSSQSGGQGFGQSSSGGVASTVNELGSGVAGEFAMQANNNAENFQNYQTSSGYNYANNGANAGFAINSSGVNKNNMGNIVVNTASPTFTGN